MTNKYFSLEQLCRAGKVECQAGLKPASLSVWLSAFTFRPPALFAPHCSLTLYLRASVVSDSMSLTLHMCTACIECYVM